MNPLDCPRHTAAEDLPPNVRKADAARAAFGRRLARALGPKGRAGRALFEVFSDSAVHSADGGMAAQSDEEARWLVARRRCFALVVRMLAAEVLASIAGHASPLDALMSAGEDCPAGSIGRAVDRAAAALQRLDEASGPVPPDLSLAPDEVDGRRAAALANAARALRSLDVLQLTRVPLAADPFRELYHAVFPRPIRHRLGEYYTPDWLADHVLDQAGYAGDPAARLLDPTCGSGVFLLAALRRVRRQWEGRAATAGERDAGPDASSATVPPAAEAARQAREIIGRVVGFELSPLAAMTARVNYLLALGPWGRGLAVAEMPVFERDSILDTATPTAALADAAPGCAGDDGETAGAPAASALVHCRAFGGPFDFVVGNPPWIAWDNLSQLYREATKPLWRQYGLFSLSGNAARHGGGKKDLAMLVFYAAADRWLGTGGRIAMVLPQTLLQTKGAGDGFRRLQLGDGAPLQVVRADDLVALRPFADATNWTCTLAAIKGAATQYPVPYFRWRVGAKGDTAAVADVLEALPVERGRVTSPWLVCPAGQGGAIVAEVGPSDYRAHLGANAAGANGVFWLEILGAGQHGVRVRNLTERGRGGLPQVEAEIEPDLLYPLVRWADVAAFRAVPRAAILLPQDVTARVGLREDELARRCPRTLAYLQQFEVPLRRRAAYRRYQSRGPFYSLYNVGPYTLASHKVIWRRMDRQLRAAVLSECEHAWLGRRPIVPQETCVLIAAESCEEAHYLCALLNGAAVRGLVEAHSVRGGKGFGTPSILDYLGLRRFDATDPRHLALAAASRVAHDEAASTQPA